MMRVGQGLAALLALSSLGCTIGRVQETPIRGTAPSAVLVLPPVSMRNSPAALELRFFATGSDAAFAGRGYRCMPLGAGYDLARRCGVLDTEQPEPDALRRLREQVGVDAALRIEVTDWRVVDDPRFSAASWDVTWRLVSTENGSELWSHRLQGNWSRAIEPVHHMDRDPTEPKPAEIGGTLRDSFRTEQELVAALHAAACARLPRNVR